MKGRSVHQESDALIDGADGADSPSDGSLPGTAPLSGQFTKEIFRGHQIHPILPFWRQVLVTLLEIQIVVKPFQELSPNGFLTPNLQSR